MKKIIIILSVFAVIALSVILFFVTKDDSPSDEITTESTSLSPDEYLNIYETDCGYVGYVNNDSLYTSSLNSDKMYISSVHHLPIFKFDTKEQLDSFKAKYFEYPNGYYSYDEMPFFESTVSHCDDEFFKENTLFAIYIESPSGSFRYKAENILIDGQTFCVTVTKANNPEVYTNDMAGWILTVSAKKETVRNCTEFDAILNS